MNLPTTQLEPESSREDVVRIFAIFDTDRDADLYALLRESSDYPDCGFSVIGGSTASGHSDSERASVRDRIREVDQVIVICGEHSESSPNIHTEFRIAIDEEKPYLLLWGRRGVMCTKPMGAAAAEGMYSWTGQIMQEQLAFKLRPSKVELEAKSLRRLVRDGRMPSDPALTRDEACSAPAKARDAR